jgi:molybdopterin-containing oxidoreductase family iron-sulfur binding subunit
MSENRRSFLKRAGGAAMGLGGGFPLLSAACGSSRAASGHEAPAEKQLALVVDIKKCLRSEVRRACIDACHRAHNVPDIPEPEDEVKWLWTEPYTAAFPDQVHGHLAAGVADAPVLVLCNQCTDPSCVRVCPTQATWKREKDGIVMMDMHRCIGWCIGCRYCMAACPYGSRSFNWRDPRDYIEKGKDGKLPSKFPTRSKGVVEKCNFCAERLREGLEPACVEAANKVRGGRGALTFGDLSDSKSEVSRILRDKPTIARRIGLGTGPNVFYITGANFGSKRKK